MKRGGHRGDWGQANEKAKSSVPLIHVTRGEQRGRQTLKGSGSKEVDSAIAQGGLQRICFEGQVSLTLAGNETNGEYPEDMA